VSDVERTGFRTLIYSWWHRPANMRRFIGPVRAAKLGLIDIDCCEYCAYCKQPVALVETAHTTRDPKSAPVTAFLARMAGIPAFSVSYSGSIKRSHCKACGRDKESGEINAFLVQQIQPPDGWVKRKTPHEYAKWLESLRDGHTCQKQQGQEQQGGVPDNPPIAVPSRG
jgi:hypothetical protein